jgi:hypothetical protein
MPMDHILGHFIPKEIICQIFCTYLSLQDISCFDVAMCNQKKRHGFLESIGSIACIWLEDKKKQFNSKGLSWLMNRNIKIRQLNISCNLSDALYNNPAKIAGFGIYLQWLRIGKQGVNDMRMVEIAKECPNLEYLDISTCYGITDISILKIAEYCSNIKHLNISECRFSDIGLIKLAECCLNIEILSIEGCISVTDKGLIQIAECLPNIKYLNTRWCQNITNKSITKIAECCHNIEILNISCCNSVTDISVIKVR